MEMKIRVERGQNTGLLPSEWEGFIKWNSETYEDIPTSPEEVFKRTHEYAATLPADRLDYDLVERTPLMEKLYDA